MKRMVAVLFTVSVIAAVHLLSGAGRQPQGGAGWRDAPKDIPAGTEGRPVVARPAPVVPEDKQAAPEETMENLLVGLVRGELVWHGVTEVDIAVFNNKKGPYLLVAFYKHADYLKVKSIFYLDSDTPVYMGVPVRLLIPAGVTVI